MGIDHYLKSIILDFPQRLGWILFLLLCIGAVLAFSVNGLKNGWRPFCKFGLELYVALLFFVTVFCRPDNVGTGSNFIPFWSYFEAFKGDRNDLIAEMIMNVVVFIPLGFLLGLSFKGIKWKHVILVSLCVSSLIEILQFIFKRGYTELDDLFHNVLGSILGYCIFLMLKGVFKSKKCKMTQDERWLVRYNEVKSFIETNHRNPSKYNPEEMLMVHFMKRGRKLVNAGEMVEPRLGMFKELLALSEQYKRKNQYE